MECLGKSEWEETFQKEILKDQNLGL
jgi:hypothetical protein